MYHFIGEKIPKKTKKNQKTKKQKKQRNGEITSLCKLREKQQEIKINIHTVMVINTSTHNTDFRYNNINYSYLRTCTHSKLNDFNKGRNEAHTQRHVAASVVDGV